MRLSGRPPNPLWGATPTPPAAAAVRLGCPLVTAQRCICGVTPVDLCRQHPRLAAVTAGSGVVADPSLYPPEIAVVLDRQAAIPSPPLRTLGVYRGRHRQEHACLLPPPLHSTAGSSRPSARSQQYRRLPHPLRSLLSLCVPLFRPLRLPHATAGWALLPFRLQSMRRWTPGQARLDSHPPPYLPPRAAVRKNIGDLEEMVSRGK